MAVGKKWGRYGRADRRRVVRRPCSQDVTYLNIYVT